MKFICFIGAIAAIALLLVFGTRSCGNFFPQETVAETQDERFKQGQTLAAEKKNREAMEAFYKVVNSRSDAPESHLELGILSLRENMPLDAIFHFRQYLRERPDSPQVTQVNDQINAARKMFLSQLPGQPFDVETFSAGSALEKKLKNVLAENDALKRQIIALREQVSGLQAGGTPGLVTTPVAGTPVRTGGQVAVAPQNPVRVPDATSVGRPPIPSTHTVVQGDTLSSISKKYYGSQNHWRKVYNYNRNIMSSPSELKLGMKLRLPPAE